MKGFSRRRGISREIGRYWLESSGEKEVGRSNGLVLRGFRRRRVVD